MSGGHTSAARDRIHVRVDPTNPGQFFACCGLLELADRLWAGAEGWFEGGTFALRPLGGGGEVSLARLCGAIADSPLQPLDVADERSSPIAIAGLRVDWWKEKGSGADQLKVWAGSMSNVRIARAMQGALKAAATQEESLFDYGAVVFDPLEPDKKVEPFYFDARRGANALAIDIGFSLDALSMRIAAYPAVEFLCFVGLQRFRPMPTKKRRVFDYYTWNMPLDTTVAASAACGLLAYVERRGFRFESAFRTDKHKAFMPATPLREE